MADLEFWFQCARVIAKSARSTRALGRCGTWGICPPEKILISDPLRSLLVAFWGETARVGRATANLDIVFETFKRSHNLKTCLRFAPRRGKIFQLATARIRSVVALWS